MKIHAPYGTKVKFIGGTKDQHNWGNNDDPNGILVVGQIYTVKRTEVHTWHTKVYLQEVPGRYNSVCFKEV